MIQSKTEWKDVQVPMRDLARALEDNELAEALRAFDRLDKMLERWRQDIWNTVVDLEDRVNV